jgi:hypothetical protein
MKPEDLTPISKTAITSMSLKGDDERYAAYMIEFLLKSCDTGGDTEAHRLAGFLRDASPIDG